MPVFCCTRHSTAFDRSDVAFYNISARKQHILKASDAEVVRRMMKDCPRCRKTRPMTIQYWFTARDRIDGFHTPCKKCYSAAKKNKSQKKVETNEQV